MERLPPGLTRDEDGRLVIDLLAYDWGKPHWLSPEGRRIASEDVRKYRPNQPRHPAGSSESGRFTPEGGRRGGGVKFVDPTQGQLDFDGAASAVDSNVGHDMCSAGAEIDTQLAKESMAGPKNAVLKTSAGEAAFNMLMTDPVMLEAGKQYHDAIVRAEVADTDMLAQIARDGRFKWSWEK